jgi:phosphoribosylformimino-5-aminoimidazole carboxamide ribonucleotide (ProFAR) isomerase
LATSLNFSWVRREETWTALLKAGADRVTVNTAAVAEPELIRRLSEKFGAQCVVLALDGKRVRGGGGAVRLVVTTHGGRRITGRGVVEWAAEAASLGAGEILLTSVDADGTREGFDVEMLRAVRSAADVPIVASGGAGKLAQARVMAGALHDGEELTMGSGERARRHPRPGPGKDRGRVSPRRPRTESRGGRRRRTRPRRTRPRSQPLARRTAFRSS